MPNVIAACLLSLTLVLATATTGQAQESWSAARSAGTHILMRHAIAPGTGDPADFALGDCVTQRNLSDAGRAQARRIGERLRQNGVPIDTVLSSQWCRSRETAELLGFGAVKAALELNSFFANRDDGAAQTAALKARLVELDAAGRKAALVSHQVNITALTDIYPASGEIVVVSVGANGDVTVAGRIRTD
ncbi:histidine phosphatase family protein [Aurantimonas marianensis]|uniref:Histidine phosphatase family protein n=1 Tax=Aurantimonas marianensis TaxID=2920428 RepID=A0A9X2H6C6_9HYPH|nr:histidine phosphatase family protein [Aurantimonas marianensis]MCP3056137.1 histidine phosphatase family protein [Aurantimonas marianensis]